MAWLRRSPPRPVGEYCAACRGSGNTTSQARSTALNSDARHRVDEGRAPHCCRSRGAASRADAPASAQPGDPACGSVPVPAHRARSRDRRWLTCCAAAKLSAKRRPALPRQGSRARPRTGSRRAAFLLRFVRTQLPDALEVTWFDAGDVFAAEAGAVRTCAPGTSGRRRPPRIPQVSW